MENHLVVFTLTNEHYGVNIAAVSEIIMLQPITFVPRAPAFVEGVTNLRGKVLPVIDLRKRFGLAVQESTRDTRIVVAEINHVSVGMIVDAVNEVLRVPAGSIEPPSPVVTTVDSAFISGIAKVGTRLIILLDLERVLQPGEKVELQQVVLQQGEMPPSAEGPAIAVPPATAGQEPPQATAPAEPEKVPDELPPAAGSPLAAEGQGGEPEAGPAPKPAARKKRGKRRPPSPAKAMVEEPPPVES